MTRFATHARLSEGDTTDYAEERIWRQIYWEIHHYLAISDVEADTDGVRYSVR